MKTIFTLVLGLRVLCGGTAFAQIVELDTTFGQGGKVETYINDVSEANAEVQQSDGKIVVTGFSYDSTKYVFATVRYNTDGSVDTTFGIEGVDTISFQNGNNYATSVAVQSNGKIVVAGYTVAQLGGKDSVIIMALVRYDSTGAIDTTFGTHGRVTTLFGSINDEIHAIAIQHDGKIVATGSTQVNTSENKLIVIRYDSTGELDSSFNSTGIVDILMGTTTVGNALSLLPDGKILIAGTAFTGGLNGFALARFKMNGTPDSTFNNTGTVITVGDRGLHANSVALEKNGKIVIGGYANTNLYNVFAAARYDTTGILDTSFGGKAGNPVLTVASTLNNSINAIAIDTSGKIVAAGFSYDAKTKLDDFTVIRYDSSGKSVDTTFGGTGEIVTGFGGAESFAQAVLIQPNDEIVLAGYALVGVKGLFALARYGLDTTTVDTMPNDTSTCIAIAGIKNNSALIYPNPTADQATLTYTLTSNETMAINIYDVIGRLVEPVITDENKTSGSYEEPLNLGALPPGFYILNLTNSNSQSLGIKLIKE